MAETEILSTTNYQVASNSCVSCLSSEATGLNQGANGDFSTHLDESIKEITVTSDGKVLPIDGNNLPQAILPQTLIDLNAKLQSFVNDVQIDEIDSNILTATYQETNEESTLSIQADINLFPETESVLEKFIDSSNISDSIEIISPELSNANEIASKIIDELSTIPIPVVQANSAAVKSVQIDSLNPTAGIIENQRVLTAFSPTSEADALQSHINDSTLEAEESINTLSAPKLDANDNSSDKLNDFIAKYLSEDSATKFASKNQLINPEIFQQNFSSTKADTALQNVNISSAIDSYGNLNAGVLQNKVVEAPVPLFIKPGVGSDKIQQSVDQSIAQNVKWLIGNKVQNAKINVFPESLGQVNIALSLEDSNLKLNFIASSTATKEMIESSMSNLKSHFGESDINLLEVNVETRFSKQPEQGSQFSDSQDKSQGNFNDNLDEINNEIGDAALHEHVINSAPLYLLDAYV